MTVHPAAALVRLAELDPVPEDADVTAGWIGLVVFLGMAVALVLLLVSLTRHLRTVRENAAAGMYEENPPRTGAPDAEPGQRA